MKTVIGVVMILGGIACGLYAGLWWAFIGGICDVIGAIGADELIAMDVAIGVAKVLFAGLIGWASAALLLIPGFFMVQD
jgi:hypothetical protein